MKTITTTANAYMTAYSSLRVEDLDNLDDASKLAFIAGDYQPSGWIKVGTATITVELEETQELVSSKVDSLKEQLQELRAESQVKIKQLEDQIANLSALTYEA